MHTMKHLFYDWSQPPTNNDKQIEPVKIQDETLRDGLQGLGITIPTEKQQIEILEAMQNIRIDLATIGFPAASDFAYKSSLSCAKMVAACHYDFSIGLTGRTIENDIKPIIEISQKSGLSIEAQLFLGSSRVRSYAEKWIFDDLLKRTKDSVKLAKRFNLPVIFITEDTTRAYPEDIERLYLCAAECGADRVNICDTVGYATPDIVYRLVSFIRNLLDENGFKHIKIDFHGHMDRGLAVWNSIAAVRAGADRIQACALGIGERCGNTPMEQLLVNLKLLGYIDKDLTKLNDYCQTVANAIGLDLPKFLPVVGENAFKTASGIHASAIEKLLQRGENTIAEFVYSGVPPSMVGCKNQIEISQMSGKWNVIHWLRRNNIELKESTIEKILIQAKSNPRALNEKELQAIVQQEVVEHD